MMMTDSRGPHRQAFAGVCGVFARHMIAVHVATLFREQSSRQLDMTAVSDIHRPRGGARLLAAPIGALGEATLDILGGVGSATRFTGSAVGAFGDFRTW